MWANNILNNSYSHQVLEVFRVWAPATGNRSFFALNDVTHKQCQRLAISERAKRSACNYNLCMLQHGEFLHGNKASCYTPSHQLCAVNTKAPVSQLRVREGKGCQLWAISPIRWCVPIYMLRKHFKSELMKILMFKHVKYSLKAFNCTCDLKLISMHQVCYWSVTTQTSVHVLQN